LLYRSSKFYLPQIGRTQFFIWRLRRYHFNSISRIMESDHFSTEEFPFTQTNRIKHFCNQNLLTILLFFLSLNIYAVPTATIKINQTPINQIAYFPFPINSSIFTSLVANTAPTVVTERILTSAITPAERRQHVAWFAESHTEWGFRYSSGNSSLEDGFDCSGFVRYVLNYFDFKASRSSSEQFKEGTQVPVSLARAGDLVFFGGKNSVSHVAMVVSNDAKGLVVVHSTCTKGIIKENITESAYWKPKLKDKAVNIIGL
jgi:cell wall-associated NlpC family hydrolase